MLITIRDIFIKIIRNVRKSIICTELKKKVSDTKYTALHKQSLTELHSAENSILAGLHCMQMYHRNTLSLLEVRAVYLFYDLFMSVRVNSRGLCKWVDASVGVNSDNGMCHFLNWLDNIILKPMVTCQYSSSCAGCWLYLFACFEFLLAHCF